MKETEPMTGSSPTAGFDGRTRIDLSHVVEDGMTTYPGLPAPVISDVLTRESSRERYAPGTEFLIAQIALCGNTGTYVDSPFHRYADGADLAALKLDRLADLDAVMVDATRNAGRAIGPEQLASQDLSGKAVLVRTDWSRHWRTDVYFTGHPYLTQQAADQLVSAGARLVGIDSLNIDGTDTGARPVHTTLLAAGIPICEHLTNLAALPDDGFRFSAVPVMVSGMGTFPVRAYATW
jgi:arylformamidase